MYSTKIFIHTKQQKKQPQYKIYISQTFPPAVSAYQPNERVINCYIYHAPNVSNTNQTEIHKKIKYRFNNYVFCYRVYRLYQQIHRLVCLSAMRTYTHFHMRIANMPNSNQNIYIIINIYTLVSGVNRHSNKYAPRNIPEVQDAFKILMIHWILQFALRIAFRCVLHRCRNLDIRC